MALGCNYMHTNGSLFHVMYMLHKKSYSHTGTKQQRAMSCVSACHNGSVVVTEANKQMHKVYFAITKSFSTWYAKQQLSGKSIVGNPHLNAHNVQTHTHIPC